MHSVLTVLVAERLGKCTVDDSAPPTMSNDGNDDEDTSEHEATVKQKATALIDIRLPTLPSLGGKYFHLWWTTLCTGAAVTYLLVDALKWAGALFLPLILIGYCHLLPIAVAEGAAAAAVAPVTLRRVAFISSVFDAARVIKGNSWTQWTFKKIRALRESEKAAKSVHIFRQFLLAVSTVMSDLTIALVFFSVVYCVPNLRDSVLNPSNILAANAYRIILRSAFTYTPMSVMAWRDIVSIVDACADFLSDSELHTNDVKMLPSAAVDKNAKNTQKSCCFVLKNIDVKKKDVQDGKRLTPIDDADGGNQPTPSISRTQSRAHLVSSLSDSLRTASHRSLADAVDLSSCSLSIPSNAITVITGCGKSTFLKLLAGEVQFGTN